MKSCIRNACSILMTLILFCAVLGSRGMSISVSAEELNNELGELREQSEEIRDELQEEPGEEIIPEEEIFFRVRKDNIASQRVLEKNGAYVSGEDDEHLFMRIRK